MSIDATTTHEGIDTPTPDQPHRRGLPTIVAQTLPFGDDLPTFKEVRCAGWAVQDSIERVAAEEFEDAN